VGASPHPPPHTPLPKTQTSETDSRAPSLPSRNRDHHCNLHVNSRHLAPKGPLHLPADTEVAHPHCLCTQATPPPTMSQSPAGLRKRRLQEGRDADGATTAKGFHPEIPCCNTKHPAMAPSTGKRRPRTLLPSPLTRVSAKTFARHALPAAHRQTCDKKRSPPPPTSLLGRWFATLHGTTTTP
jgi:hypothetical protein